MKKHLFFTIIIVFVSSAFAKAYSQETLDTLEIPRKKYRATRIYDAPKIDGKPFEKQWEGVTTGANFVMVEPVNLQPERQNYRTEFKIAYDDEAVYVAGFMYDENPEEILRQFSQRDQINVQADLFSIWINTYNNGIDQTRFYATSANALGDARSTNGGEDFSFNVVFLSETSIDDNGWYVEMKIPYRTLRFPEVNVQDWSFNIFRRIRHLNEDYSYNPINITEGNVNQYDALLTGIEDIDPPLRLNLYPFVSTQSDWNKLQSETVFNAGMDIKYGINDAFTLDATLIPDFGQAAFDRVVLNLGPFEQVFGENRQFFIEGTELFRKGDIFFSRRIGQRPTQRGNLGLEQGETVIENPRSADLLNAIKVSGRTSKGLGIGVLNAVTGPTDAIIEDSNSGDIREVRTEPLVNYNVLVLDQTYGNNSAVSLTNASTLRDGSFTDANATAIEVTHNNNQNTVRYFGRARMTNRFLSDDTSTGFSTSAVVQKITGNWRPRIEHYFADTTFDPNDLGQQFRNNYNNFSFELEYNRFLPQGIFNNWNIELDIDHNRAYNPGIHTGSRFNINPFFFTKERFAFGANFTYATESKDLFESRIDGLFTNYPARFFMGGFISSDYRKKLAIDANAGINERLNDEQLSYDFSISPRYRFSDKFLLVYRINWFKNDGRLSYVTLLNDGNSTRSIFSRRYDHSVENTLTGNLNLSNRLALNLTFRNFWQRSDFAEDLQELQASGDTAPSTFRLDEEDNPDRDFNVWNLDLSFRYRFAPGSEVSVLYRNRLNNVEQQAQLGFNESFDNLLKEDFNHTISVRLSYFLDFNKALQVINKNA
ncbi:DUF5916 domain-containing protein [Nonlabens tegetincola]|uniref:DUF5916 domain-containing protein n=1 Tax=Nonlabens tegetincola TaxID=323273 RepID=UPI000CF4049A|nr:DUF5916 domain-containing protein [Nonlabens tegetincola]PQJ17131.1 hydrolase [Nonlabens tegetincola]